ncbi:hypothetical protein TanjilG_06146 [Lupinus angustifolius]|uniref:Uncharacterized protein n=1 Tax=Lupinus angustifolius TaxID=3871 RepID=A0A1J7GVV2_LUPAN|nr:hypothetical protein TanjilG_06146 [Lupinus angustifolius]
MNADGNDGLVKGKCSQRKESSPLNDKRKSLVLVNHFKTVPVKAFTAKDNSKNLIDMLSTCYGAAGNRWANFVAVDFYKKCQGGGAFEATDKLNWRLMCGCDDLHACAVSLFTNLLVIWFNCGTFIMFNMLYQLYMNLCIKLLETIGIYKLIDTPMLKNMNVVYMNALLSYVRKS